MQASPRGQSRPLCCYPPLTLPPTRQPLRCLDLSFNDGLRDCHLEALSPDGTGPPLDLTRRLTQWGQSDQRGAASFEAEFAEAAKAAKAAKAAQKKQAAVCGAACRQSL